MKQFAQISFALFAVIFGVGICSAQSTPAISRTPTETFGNAKVYRLKNKLTIEADLLNRDGKSIKVTFDSPIAKVTKPGMVNLEFYGFWKGFGKPTNSQTEIVWGAGERLAGESNFQSKSCYSPDGIECYEFLFSLPIAYETIEKMSNSENVTITFGEITIKLSSAEIRSLRDVEESFAKQ